LPHFLRGGFYGSTTVGERGQIVIPVKARKELGLAIGDKVMVFGRPHRHGLVLIKADEITRIVSEGIAELADLGRFVESAETASDQEDHAGPPASPPPPPRPPSGASDP
jgi:AbrB family looped-hinge helix DNA binding protein